MHEKGEIICCGEWVEQGRGSRDCVSEGGGRDLGVPQVGGGCTRVTLVGSPVTTTTSSCLFSKWFLNKAGHGFAKRRLNSRQITVLFCGTGHCLKCESFKSTS